MALKTQFLTVLVFHLLFNQCRSWIVDPGPQVIATKGEVWPKPQQEQKKENYYILSSSDFDFNIISENCSILEEAKLRYINIILTENRVAKKYGGNNTETEHKTDKFIGYLQSLDVSLTEPCTGQELPELYMDENYMLTIPTTTSENPLLKAKSVWGILRGLETFSQAIYTYDNDGNLYVNATDITDYPRFPHRGLMIDTSRHYLTTDVIYKHLDAMSYNKMNVFHWHIVDDQSFPYESTMYPELSDKGAYNQHMIYTLADIRAILEYARLRGIRVIPEFDTPGHTRSWGEGIPELLSSCYEHGMPTGRYGPMDPSRQFVFSFLGDFLDELKSIFPDKQLHLGGDEVPYDCWKNNPDINNFMASINIKRGDYKALQRYHMEKLFNIAESKNITGIVWEEVYKARTKIPKDSIVQVWYTNYDLLKQVTASGLRAIYSSCWYLDSLANGGDWNKYYECEPQNFGGSSKQLKLVLGGEACMWAEVVNNENVLERTWPRASAAAEKLWSAYDADHVSSASRRLEEHACRMNRRNIPAQPPNGPGYCLT